MDPSEFEDTVERNSEALDAGALETFLNGPTEIKETFSPFDIAKEAGDIYLAIYNLQQCLLKFAEVGSEDFMAGLDEKALKIAEFKEDYLLRRKKLTGAVKKHMQELSIDGDNDGGKILAAIKEKSLAMVELFKCEYDTLSTFAKFSEASFVITYKDIRDFIPESKNTLKQALAACLSTQEIFKRAQEQFRIADNLLSAMNVSSHNNSNQASSHHHIDPIMSFTNLSDLDRQLQKQREEFDRDTETLKQQHLTELHDLRTRYEKDYRNQELTMQQSYEQRFLQLQQRCDESILRKDNEIASLLHRVDTLQTQSMQWDERSKALDAEYHRRQQLEEKLRQALLDLSEANSAAAKTQQTLDQSRKDFNDLLLQMKTEAQNALKQQNKAQEQIDEFQRRLHQHEQQALENPPRDLNPLLDRIGYTSSSSSSSHNHDDRDSGSRRSVPWASVEAFIIERIRRLDSENISLRLAEQDRNATLKALQEQYDELAPRLVDRNQVIAALEKDLLAAQEALRQRKSQAYGMISSTTMPSSQSAVMSQAQAVRLVTDSIDMADIETTVEPTTIPPTDSSANDTVNLQQAIVNQRDRYMKNCRELEQQIVVIKQQEVTLQSKVQRLTQENLELYERLRTLRTDMRSRKTSSIADNEEHADELELGKGGLGGPGSNTTTGATGDSLDRRYSQLFQQQFLSKLIPGDRWIASSLRYILQDQYTRMAFMLYIVIIHLCALVYVFQVLTPQWKEEIDAQQKAKWSLSTLSLPEHPDA